MAGASLTVRPRRSICSSRGEGGGEIGGACRFVHGRMRAGRPSTSLRINSKQRQYSDPPSLRNFGDHAGGSWELGGVPSAAESFDELDAGRNLLGAQRGCRLLIA